MTVKEIVKLYLEANGYDGLFNQDDYDGCGCHLDDLFPCEGSDCAWVLNCIPGYKAPDTTGEGDFIIQEDTP